MTTTTAILIAAYVSYLVEIFVFPVPSVVSTYQMIFTERAHEEPSSTAVRLSREEPLLRRLAWFAAPTLASIVFFVAPILVLLSPRLYQAMIPIPALQSNAVTAVGSLSIVIGRTITFSSVLIMRRGWGRWFQPAIPESLREEELFRKSRNPGLVGMFLFYFGLFATFPSVFMLIGFPIYFGNMHYRVLLEESHLEHRYGDAFQQYKLLTRRYL